MQILFKIVLAPVFFIVVTPLAVIMRMLGVDLIDREIDKNQITYWQSVKTEQQSTASDKPE